VAERNSVTNRPKMQLSDAEISRLKQKIATLEAELAKAYATFQSATNAPPSLSPRQALISVQHHTSHIHSELHPILHHLQSIETDWIEDHTVKELKEVSKIILGIVLLKEIAGSVLLSKHTVNRLFLLSSAIGGVWLLFRLTAGTVTSWFGMLNRNKQRKMYILGKLQEIQDHLEALREVNQLVREEGVEKGGQVQVEEGEASQPTLSSSSGGDNNNKSDTSSTSGEMVLVGRDEEAGPPYTEMEPLRQYASLSHSPLSASSSPPSGGADKKKNQ